MSREGRLPFLDTGIVPWHAQPVALGRCSSTACLHDVYMYGVVSGESFGVQFHPLTQIGHRRCRWLNIKQALTLIFGAICVE